MKIQNTALAPGEYDLNLLHRLFFVQQVCLVLAIQVGALSLAALAFAPLRQALPHPLVEMDLSSSISTLLCALALFASDSEASRPLQFLSQMLATLAILLSILSLFNLSRLSAASFGSIVFPTRQNFALANCIAPLAFFLLGSGILFIRAKSHTVSRLLDGAIAILALLVLVLFSEFLYGIAHVPGSTIEGLTSPPTLFCLLLLTVVVFLRRAEFGIFSLFLEFGIGSRIARILTPFLLILPMLREIGRARLVNIQIVPTHYATAILSSVATMISFAFLFFLVGRINGMQNQIQDLTLRDELTGLYNVRGFNLLADQALRLSRRAKRTFTVLFIDLDNLKVINDKLGHSTGSATLVETAKLLIEAFRETDVIGRVGGDEFVVAGEFDSEAIATVIKRLHARAESRNQASGRRISLSFSAGFANTEEHPSASLKDLVGRADQAMYEEKRLKKPTPA